jgi:hypothetical protein
MTDWDDNRHNGSHGSFFCDRLERAFSIQHTI